MAAVGAASRASAPAALPPAGPKCSGTAPLVIALPLLLPTALGAWVLGDEAAALRRMPVLVDVAISAAGFLLCYLLIPYLKHYLDKADIHGKDLNKPGSKEDKPWVPEGLGVVCGTVFLSVTIVGQLFWSYRTANLGLLMEYNAALMSICFMVLLGFIDDSVDLPWRYKLVLPTVGSLPLLVAYAGATSIIVPAPLRIWLGRVLQLGYLYYAYMGMLAVFCTNAINIYAGINGLEAGQSFIIACSVLVHNLVELNGPYGDQHMFSINFILPFIGVTLGLLYYNWYPSRVFVGDTFCYFAGMTFAVVGILGHFSKTLLLFFVPQVINFVYSLPQLLGCVPIARHRLPKLNPASGKLEGQREHMNLVNLTLRVLGPKTEDQLCRILLWFQVLCCAGAFVVRYYVATFFYP